MVTPDDAKGCHGYFAPALGLPSAAALLERGRSATTVNVAWSFRGWMVRVPFEEIATWPPENALLLRLFRIRMIPRTTRQRPPTIRTRFISIHRHRLREFCISAMQIDLGSRLGRAFRIECVSQAVANKIERQQRRDEQAGRKDDQPPVDANGIQLVCAFGDE